MRFRVRTILLVFLLISGLVLSQTGGTYDLSWNTIDGGGGVNGGGTYVLAGVAGQPDAGIMGGGTYILSGGFLSVPTVVVIPDVIPTNLTVSGQGTAPVLPVFSWTGVTAATNYRIYVQTAAGAMVMDVTFAKTDICQNDVVCSISDGDYSSIPAWGLTNDSYQWWVGAQNADSTWVWSGGANYDPALFAVNIAGPLLPVISVNPGDGRVAVYWPDDLNTLWVNLWLGPHSAGNYFEWLSREDLGLGSPVQDEFTCDGTNCVAYPTWDVPTATDQTAWMQSWGPGGFSTGGTAAVGAPAWNQMSKTVDGAGVETAATTFALPADAPTVPTNIGVADATAAAPTLVWTGQPGSTWYEVIMWDPIGGDVPLNNWYQAMTANCPGALVDPPDYDCELTGLGLTLTSGTEYEIYIRVWGPGGFSTGGTPYDPYGLGTFTYSPA